ncbi:alpha-2,3-sialyltransferase [uncultured Helicobacter sp.]|uniref:alpha-2,3-sialyltransferase n=1 Tax=uncultured Helicobacter sp. TaxID=175537 RepID=UPI0037502E00
MSSLCDNIYNTRLYTIAPSSPLCEHIPLAPVQNPQPNFTPEQKPQNCIKDILLPEEQAYRNYHKRQKSVLEKNVYYTLIRDLLRLPSNIKNHFKDKKY